jgi:hypothetical protein
LLKVKDIKGVEFKADARLGNPDVDPKIVEAVMMPNSRLIGRTVQGIGLLQVYVCSCSPFIAAARCCQRR